MPHYTGVEFSHVEAPDPRPKAAKRANVVPLTVFAATITLMQNIMGAGVLALPYAMKSAGLCGGLVILMFIYFLTLTSMHVLVLVASHLNEFSLHGMAKKTLGGWWPVFLDVWVLCYTCGICTSYPIILGDILHQLAKTIGAGAWSTQRVWMTLVVTFVCWPLSCVESLGHLKVMSAAGLAGICFTVVTVLKRCNDGTYGKPGQQNVDILNLQTFGSCFPILVTALGAHCSVPSLFLEIVPRNDRSAISISDDAGNIAQKNMCRVLLYAVTISTFVYGIIGTTVYVTFGSYTNPDFSGNYHSNDTWMVVVRMTLAAAICTVFPLTIVSSRTSLFNLMNKIWNACHAGNAGDVASRACPPPTMTRALQFAISTGITGMCFTLAVCVGNIGVVLDYSGLVFGIPVCYIAPVAMYLCLPRHKQRVPLTVSCKVCALAGVVFAAFGVIEVSASHHSNTQ